MLDRLAEGLDPMTELFPVSLAAAVGAPDITPRMRPRPAPIIVRTKTRDLNPRAATELSKASPAGLTGPVAVELARAEETGTRPPRTARQFPVRAEMGWLPRRSRSRQRPYQAVVEERDRFL